MPSLATTTRSGTALLCAFALVTGCRDKSPAAATDSVLAQDLALAQRTAPPQTVFNDAPLGGSTPASRAPAAPNPRREPPRVSAPTPKPSPRRESPPAQVARLPRRTLPEPVATAPAPAPAPAPAAPAPGLIGAGSRVGMTTNARVCTNALLLGDKFTATVSSATIGSNGATIPAGSTVVLEIASVNRADPVEASRVEFRVRSIDVNGDSYPVSGDVATLASLERVDQHTGNDRGKVVGGAVVGAVLGRILGRSTRATVIGAAAGAAAGTVAAARSNSADACLPQGSPLRLTLTRDIVSRRIGSI